MTLIISPHKPSSKASFTYNWESIGDTEHRGTARVLVESLRKSYESSIKEVEGIARRYTNYFSRTVWTLKRELPHGLFQDVCRQALNLNDDQMACYAQIGKYIEEGAVFGKALQMVDFMEPRAASRFLKASDETKSRHVATFEATGKIPSRRDFTIKTEHNEQGRNPPRSEPPLEVTKAPTKNANEARQRMKESGIRLVDACAAVAQMLRFQTQASPQTQEILRALRTQIDYLLKAPVNH
jgi:hypothetical protein